MSKDPILFQGGLNLYGYVGNDPINYIDPTGLTKEDVMRAIQIASKEFPILKAMLPQFENLGPDTVGRSLLYPLGGNKLLIHSDYLGELTSDQKLGLLNTIFHEAQHLKDGYFGDLYDRVFGKWNKKYGMTEHHYNIYLNSMSLTDKYSNEMLCQ